MHHVLEHLRQTSEEFMKVLAELHRICKSNVPIEIFVLQPHHFTFMGDPTHERTIIPEQFSLFDKDVYPESPLRESPGLELGGQISNVFDETRMIIKVIK